MKDDSNGNIFWIVWNASGVNSAPRAAGAKYTSAEAAEQASRTLALQYPGKEFFVMKAEAVSNLGVAKTTRL